MLRFLWNLFLAFYFVYHNYIGYVLEMRDILHINRKCDIGSAKKQGEEYYSDHSTYRGLNIDFAIVERMGQVLPFLRC